MNTIKSSLLVALFLVFVTATASVADYYDELIGNLEGDGDSVISGVAGVQITPKNSSPAAAELVAGRVSSANHNGGAGWSPLSLSGGVDDNLPYPVYYDGTRWRQMSFIKSTPSGSSSACVIGAYTYDTSGIHICYSDNTWGTISYGAGGGGSVTQVTGDSMIAVANGTTTPALSLTDNSITNAKLVDGTVATGKILDNTIANADINSAAAIDATKIADGTVTSAEFQYLGDVTSLVQAQLNAKEGTLTNSAGLAAALSDETGTGLVVFGTGPTIGGATINAASTVDNTIIGGSIPVAGSFTSLTVSSTTVHSDTVTLNDDVGLRLGTDADYICTFVSSTQQLRCQTAITGSTMTDTDPVFYLNMANGGAADSGQRIFGVAANGTQKFYVDDSGNATTTGEMTSAGFNSSVADGYHFYNVMNTSGESFTETAGDTYYDNTLKVQKTYDGSAWRTYAIVVAAPSTASDSCTPGMIAFDATYFYDCRATDTWMRISHATW